MGTLSFVWGLKQRQSIKELDFDRYACLQFYKVRDQKLIVSNGPWFFGKLMLALVSW